MTYDNKEIVDLTVFASEHDDDGWEGAEPTKAGRPSTMPPKAPWSEGPGVRPGDDEGDIGFGLRVALSCTGMIFGFFVVLLAQSC